MPPIVAAVVAGGLTTLMIEMEVAGAFMTVISVAMAAYSMAAAASLRPPSSPSYTQQIHDRKVMIRSSNQTRSIVYGEIKVSGPLAFASVTGDDNEFLHLVIPLASHEVNQIGDVYFNDQLSTFYDEFTVPDDVKIYYEATATTFTATVNGQVFSEAAINLLQASILTIGNLTVTNTAINSNGVSMNLLRISETTDGGGFTLADTTYTTTEILEAKIEIIGKHYSPYRISKHIGSVTQAADSDLVSEVDEWTTAHRLRGIAYLYVRLRWKDKVFMTGIPTITAIVQGKKVLNYVTNVNEYSTNTALCIADYLTSTDGFGASTSEIDTTSIIVAQNACDELVTLTTSPFAEQNRYELNGHVRLDVSPRKNLDGMKSAMAGSIVYSQGVFKMYAGVYTSPVRTLTIDDLAGDIKIRAKASRSDAFNAVKGTFSDPAQFYESVDFPAVTNALYQFEDGEQIFSDIELGFTTDVVMAQRIAKIMLEKGRQDIAVDFPANLGALELTVNDTVRLDIDQLGWGTIDGARILAEDGGRILNEAGGFILAELSAGKQFKVQEWKLNPSGRIDLVLVEESSGIYDWNLGEETPVDLAPNTNLPNAFISLPPSSLLVESGDTELLVGKDGSVISRMLARWTPPADAFIVEYNVGWKKASDAQWSQMKTTQPEMYIASIEDGTLYDIRVNAVNAIGVASSFIETTHTVVGKAAPPPDIDTFLVRAMGDGTREFTWTFNSQPLDHAGFKLRYKNGSGGTWATMTELHTGILLASPFESNQLAAGAYTFGLKAVDTSGNESVNAKVIELTLPDPRIVGALDFLDFRALGWTGTLLNGWISGDGDIHAKDQRTWADFLSTVPYPDVVDWASWTTWAIDPFPSMTYTHGEIDVGIVTKFIPLVSITTDSTEITIEERHSNTSGSGYSGWLAISGSEIEARYIEIRVKVEDTVNVPALINLVTIETVTVTLSAKIVSEDIEDLDTSTLTPLSVAGHYLLPILNTYTLIKRVDVVLQNVLAGWTWVLISKDDGLGVPQAEIKIYNGSGVLADATIDATIRGL